MLIARRNFLLGLLVLTAFSLAQGSAFADQGSGGSSGGGSSGSGSSGSGSSGSGSSGGGDNNDDDDDDDNEGSGGGGDKEKDDDKKIVEDDIRDAVESGKAMSLRKAMKRAKDQTNGRIIDVNLVRKSSRFIYVFTVVEPSGRVEQLRMDAVSGRFAGLLGF